MAKTTWGRKETIIWPYYRPLYTYGTVLVAVMLTRLASLRSPSLRKHNVAAVLHACL